LYVSPLQALRVQDESPATPKGVGILVIVGIVVFIFIFSRWLLEDWRYSLWFIVGMLFIFSILAGIAMGFMRFTKRHFPFAWGFPARQSLLNLFRPQNQTLTLVLAIGMGMFLISTLYFTKDILLAQASLDTGSNSANMILLDVQEEQKEGIAKTIRDKELSVLEDIPIVTMRVQNINGRSVNAIRQDTTSKVNRWILSHEFRVTYRDSLIASEIVEAGVWIPSSSGNSPIPISVSDNFAEDAKVQVGDEIDFNVQGVLLKTIIGSIRTVDWSRMQMNFSIVFPEGVLEKAPQFRVLTTRVPDEKVSAALQKDLVKGFPNVSILDMRQLLFVVEGLLGKISWLINFMALFSILTGVIVLLGAVRTSKYQRMKESVLLRTLGARNRQILKIFALEYLFLGVLAGIAGMVLAVFASVLLARLVFDAPFIPSLFPFLVLFPGIVILVLAIGLGNSLRIIKSPPLEVLRKEVR
jgi:putative ABC transport system permease protein